jgi:Ca2+-binding RTX toxin-like protein
MLYGFRGYFERQLLPSGIGSLDTNIAFTLPDPIAVGFVRDNDVRLTGDERGVGEDQADDTTAQVLTRIYEQEGPVVDRNTLGSPLYYESVMVVSGGGATYVMAELETEDFDLSPGEGDDFFVFLGAAPGAGTTLVGTQRYQDAADLPALARAAAGIDVANNGDLFYRDFANGIHGTGGKNRLEGTGADEAIEGRGGADRLIGNGGIDLLFGGPGKDVVLGGTGGDDLFGQGGNDTLRGGADDDHLFGGSGRDRLFGQAGPDELDGGSGNDRLVGGSSRDRLEGGAGNDVLDGGQGRDVLRGEGGRDRLIGGTENDRMNGGGGRDTFIFDLNKDQGTDRITGFTEDVDRLLFRKGDDVDLSVVISGGDTRIDYAAGRIILADVEIAQNDIDFDLI